ncbi:MAG: hypothetical protein ABSG16_17020 [Candidatus Acidiferrum sp.]|jgi:hypothetical protein
MTDQSSGASKKSSPALVLLAWVVVSIPAAWGVYNTGLNAVKLFTETSTSVSGKPITAPSK